MLASAGAGCLFPVPCLLLVVSLLLPWRHVTTGFPRVLWLGVPQRSNQCGGTILWRATLAAPSACQCVSRWTPVRACVPARARLGERSCRGYVAVLSWSTRQGSPYSMYVVWLRAWYTTCLAGVVRAVCFSQGAVASQSRCLPWHDALLPNHDPARGLPFAVPWPDASHCGICCH